MAITVTSSAVTIRRTARLYRTIRSCSRSCRAGKRKVEVCTCGKVWRHRQYLTVYRILNYEVFCQTFNVVATFACVKVEFQRCTWQRFITRQITDCGRGMLRIGLGVAWVRKVPRNRFWTVCDVYVWLFGKELKWRPFCKWVDIKPLRKQQRNFDWWALCQMASELNAPLSVSGKDVPLLRIFLFDLLSVSAFVDLDLVGEIQCPVWATFTASWDFFLTLAPVYTRVWF